VSDTCIKTRITVYDGVLSRLRESIASGDRAGGDFVGTEQELARQNGISRVSIRRATDQLIREGLIERRAGKGLFVRGPETQKRVVQVVVPDLAFEQCVQIARGAQTLASERGLEVQVYDAHNQMDRDIEVLSRLPESAAQGALILSWHHPRFTQVLLDLHRQNFPFVLVDEHSPYLEVNSVTADNYDGGMRVGHALIDYGHRRIGFIGNMSADTIQSRLEGLRDAIGDRGLPFDRSLVVDLAVQPQDDWAERIRICTTGLLRRPDRPTAIFFSDDQVAAEGYGAIRGMGLRVPQDVSVVGFDDSPFCRWLEPPLASVGQPSSEMGRAAMEMLLSQIDSPTQPKTFEPLKLKLPVHWSPRASIGPAFSAT